MDSNHETAITRRVHTMVATGVLGALAASYLWLGVTLFSLVADLPRAFRLAPALGF